MPLRTRRGKEGRFCQPDDNLADVSRGNDIEAGPVKGTDAGGIMRQIMKAYVYVSLKKSVLDPQGKTIQGALKKMGYRSVAEVRQGKYFEVVLEGETDEAQAQREVERMAREVLTNPVIEEYRVAFEKR
jgi:phosphoribosylformylglycinamidine synthase